MDKNRIEGAAKQVKGSVKEAIGRVTGDKSTELEGAAEKNVGKVQRKAGEVADDVRDAVKSPK
ncbi:CsbD family protein [Xanthomonas campestris pv. paulliniae]|uniref:CsbD family protein n=1 Tax=Xanthomonas euvesicatoria TaxID=456327 RepID=UPI001C448B42|nr:CsbD family protein [Xanthomonas euvesicatoria]MBV6846230.1 CsbD family protein [Xanthomonas campestris pv. paulliniae]